jgi:homoserine dehydrogenase
LALWSDRRLPGNIDTPGNLAGRFYLRFHVDDQPGVLAQIAGILGQCKISIASVFQHDSIDADESGVPVVIMTHRAIEQSAQAAVDQIAKLPVVRDDYQRLRILDQDFNP